MILTTRTGSAGAAGCLAYATYVAKATLETGADRAAEYYARGLPEPQALNLKPDLSAPFAARLGIDQSKPLAVSDLAHLLNNRTTAGDEIEGKKRHSPHQSVASVFGLDAKELPIVDQMKNILAGKRGDGDVPRDGWKLPDGLSRIEELGVEVNAGRIGYSEALDELMRKEIVNGPDDLDLDAMEERLGGSLALAVERADIAESGGNPLPAARVDSAVRRFKAAIGVPRDRDATPEELQRVADGRIDVVDFRRQITAVHPPTGFVDLTLSADKSISVAYALAPTEAEREIILQAFQSGARDAMAYAEKVLGWARRGAGGAVLEPAELCHVAVQHYTTRPVVDVTRFDAEGREFIEPVHVPGGVSDVQLHQHTLVLSSVMTAAGHVGSIDLSRLDGETKVIGAVGAAAVATRLREHGVEMVLGPHGEARIAAIPDWVRDFNSRRTTQGEIAAREFAPDWDRLTEEERAQRIDAGVARTRLPKNDERRRPDDEETPDIERWKRENEAAGYQHRSVLRPGQRAPAVGHEQRIELARETALKLLDEAFQRSAALTMGELREITARGLIVSGLGSDANADINEIIQTYRDRGVMLHGKVTSLITGTDIGQNRRAQDFVTTQAAIDQEEHLIDRVRTLAQDRSMVLTPAQIDQAAERFLASHPKIDPNGAQWQAQLALAHQIGEGGKVSLSIGVAGSGKTSSVVAILVDAWHAQGRPVYGMTVPWRGAEALRDAGVDQALAIDAFVRRVEKGQIKLDSRSVIVVDEVSQLSVRHQTDLMRVVGKSGAQLVEIGDPRQTQAVEWPAMELMATAIGDDNIPKLLTTIRQKTERDREVAGMFRDGEAGEAIAALREDNRFHLVAGGKDATIKHTVDLWRSITDANKADPDHTLLTIAPTNEQARVVGGAIRENRIAAGEINETAITLKARDPNSGATYDLPVSVGDKLRMFTRAKDADHPKAKEHLVLNGSLVDVLEVRPDGLRVRNSDGVEGRLEWRQMKEWRAPTNDPLMVTYGYATTPDAAQSLTRSLVIFAMPEGSAPVAGGKAYTAMSRHEAEAHMVVSRRHEAQAITDRQQIGQYHVPGDAEIIRNLGANMSRFNVRSPATEALRRAANVTRGSIGGVWQGEVASQTLTNTNQIAVPSRVATARLEPIIRQVVEVTRHVYERAHEGLSMRR